MCSGYNRPIMEVVLEAARAQGLLPEAWTCGNDEGTNGRPTPWMAVEVATALNAYPLGSVVKVDDTTPGIAEGLNAGMWTVGVSRSGSYVGVGAGEVEGLGVEELAHREGVAKEAMHGAGAHYVISGVEDLPGVVDDINARIAAGEVAATAGQRE